MRSDVSGHEKSAARCIDVEKVVENRTAHYASHSEAARYFTNCASHADFLFSNPIICRLTQGFKAMSVNASRPFDFEVGDVLFVPQGMMINVDLSTASQETPVECECFEIEATHMHRVLGRLNSSNASLRGGVSLEMDWHQFVVIPKQEASYLRLDHLMNLFMDPDSVFAEARIETGIDEMVLALLQKHGRDLIAFNDCAATDDGVNAAAYLIRERLHLHLPILDLAKIACMSESTLQRQFLKRFGQTPSRYAQHLRITKARRLLEQHGNSVERISEELGFSSAGHFTRVFRQYTGESPAGYRRKRTTLERL